MNLRYPWLWQHRYFVFVTRLSVINLYLVYWCVAYRAVFEAASGQCGGRHCGPTDDRHRAWNQAAMSRHKFCKSSQLTYKINTFGTRSFRWAKDLKGRQLTTTPPPLPLSVMWSKFTPPSPRPLPLPNTYIKTSWSSCSLVLQVNVQTEAQKSRPAPVTAAASEVSCITVAHGQTRCPGPNIL